MRPHVILESQPSPPIPVLHPDRAVDFEAFGVSTAIGLEFHGLTVVLLEGLAGFHVSQRRLDGRDLRHSDHTGARDGGSILQGAAFYLNLVPLGVALGGPLIPQLLLLLELLEELSDRVVHGDAEGDLILLPEALLFLFLHVTDFSENDLWRGRDVQNVIINIAGLLIM